MSAIFISQAKSVAAVEAGAISGHLVAKLVAVGRPEAGERIGVAKGRFVVPETIDADEAAITTLFAAT